jgi:hypothetical protein
MSFTYLAAPDRHASQLIDSPKRRKEWLSNRIPLSRQKVIAMSRLVSHWPFQYPRLKRRLLGGAMVRELFTNDS